MSKPNKYIFTLRGINIEQINAKYGIESCRDNFTVSEDNPDITTKLTALNHIEKGTPEIISFLDESKCTRSCSISMIDFVSKMDVNLLRYNCFWCRHPVDTKPIGCPTKYISNQAVKKYHSHISKDTYIIKENITNQRSKNIDSVQLNIGDYYETDGVFCSFNCCQAFINDNKHIRLYDYSTMLLVKMYNHIMNTKTRVITPAPHWRILDHYGGHLNILQFRDSFNKIDYECHGYTKPLPNFLPLYKLYEEKIKF